MGNITYLSSKSKWLSLHVSESDNKAQAAYRKARMAQKVLPKLVNPKMTYRFVGMVLGVSCATYRPIAAVKLPSAETTNKKDTVGEDRH